MKTFFSVSAALIAVPLLFVGGCVALMISSAGDVENRERDCMQRSGKSRDWCERRVSAEISQEFDKSWSELKEASGDLKRSLQ